MKKIYFLLLTTLLTVLNTLQLSAQNTLTVANGTTINEYVPIYGYWADAAQHNQVIYPESMLMNMQNYAISSMTFYLSSSPSNPTWGNATFTIKLGIATDSSFASASYATATLTEVHPASGIQIISGELTLEFETPFVYTGGNLLLDITSTSGTYSSASFFGINASGGSINQYTPQYGSNSPTLRDFIPKTTFEYGTPSLCLKPTNVVTSNISPTGTTISWTGDENASSYNIEYMSASLTDWTNAQTTTSPSNTIDLTGLNPASSYKARIQTVCSDNTETNWSSVQFTTLPSCATPTNLTATNLTSTSTDLVWTAGYDETEWEIEYGPQDFTHGTGTSVNVSGTTSYEMLNLTPNTRYDVYIRAICSDTDTSAWSVLTYFLTPCDATTLPYTENFDSYPTWYSPDCWRKYENGNSGGYVSFGAYIYNQYPYSGSNALKFEAGSSSSGYAYLRLPDFDTDDISGLQMKFMVKKQSGSRPIIVGIAPDFNSIDSIFIINTFSDLTSTYTEKIVSFESYPSTIGYIVIGLPNGYSSYATYYVDDLRIETRPNCMYPTNFEAVPVGETSATLSWTGETDGVWNIEYGPMGFVHGAGTTVTVTDSTVFTIEDLASSTAYDFYVQTNCGTMTSQWVGPVTVVTSQYSFGITGSDTITTCGMILYDDGGIEDNYSPNSNYTLVINPATEGSGIAITGTVNTYNATPSYAGVLTIYGGVGTSGELLGTFSGIKTVNIAYAGPVTINFTSGNYYSGIGFELIAQCTDCFPPANVTLSDITMTGVTASWIGSSSEYALYLTSTSDTIYTTSTENTYTFNTLTPASHYTMYIRSLCGNDSSLLSPAVTFNTSCDAITITESTPWFENFEGYTSNQFVCWETPVMYTANNGTFPLVYRGYAQSCHSGVNSVELKGPEQMLVLPEFDNDIQDLRLSFWATKTSGATGTMEIGIITDILGSSTFQVLIADAGTPGPRGDNDGVSGNGRYMGPFDFNGATTTSGRIALRYTDASASTTPGQSASSWNLDDFTVELAPGCPSPVKTSVQYSNVDGHNATISFTDNDPNHNSWTVYYKASDDADWSFAETDTTSATLTDLDPETTYEVYVVTNCTTPDQVADATNHIHFTTTVACPAPQNVTVSDIGMSTATVTWSSNASSFNIEYGPVGFTQGTGTPGTSTTNTYDLSGLISGTAYTIYVTADCGSADGTSSATSVNFNTALCDIEDQCTFTFNLSDSYGDGWNGSTLAVKQNGIIVATLGLTTGNSATETVNLCHSISTELVWNAGSYSSEASFTITDPNNILLYTSPSMDEYTTNYIFMPNCSGCVMPTDLTVSGDATTAVISWTGSADSYIVEYGEAGFTPGTGIAATVTSTTHNLTALNSSTNYTVYITSVCTEDTSSPATITFTTSCETITDFPYTEGFENGLVCWISTPTVGSVNWTVNSSYNYNTSLPEGTSCVVASTNTHGPETELASPIFDLTSLANPYLSFYHIQTDWASDQDELHIYYKDAPSATPVLLTSFTNSISSWQMDSIALPNPSSQYQIIFKATLDYGYGVGLDMITVYDNYGSTPAVIDPTVTTNDASDVAQTTATLNGAVSNPSNMTITARGFEWKADSDNEYTTVTLTSTANTLTHNLTNLTPNTDYTYKAFIIFNGETVYGSVKHFTTEAVGIDNITMANSINLMPNPADHYIDLRVNSNVEVKEAIVYNAFGQMIQTVTLTDNHARIDLSDMAAGMYFVRVSGDNVTATKKFIRK